jgi:hypothetical protein
MRSHVPSNMPEESRRILNAFPVTLAAGVSDLSYPECPAEIRKACLVEKSIGHIELRVRTDRTGVESTEIGSIGLGSMLQIETHILY